MGIRELKQEKLKQEIENYEHNISLHLKHSQEELNTIIRNSIPGQFVTIRTILWINVVFLGLTLTRTDTNSISIVFMTLSFLAIGFCFLAMYTRKQIMYGPVEKVGYMNKMVGGKWSKYHALQSMLYQIIRAIRYNGMSITKRGIIIRVAMLTSFVAFLFLVMSLTCEVKLKENIQNDQQKTNTTSKTYSYKRL